jgi:glucosylglycerol-phosphate synthase
MTDALWLCTDLDGTFLGGPAQSRRRLYDFLEKDPAAHLMFVTGRGLESVIPLLNDPTIPTPEYVIADVGGTVVSAPSLEPVQPLQSEIDRRWVGMHAVRERLKDLDGLEVQTVPQERRLSFFAHDHTVITTVIERVAELNCDVLLSADLYLDVLPAGVNKGTTLLRLLDALKIQTDFALTAGDTLNDLALFETGLPGVVVGNAELALLEATRKRANVYHAKDHGAAGILEAIRSRSERIPPAIDTKHNGDADLVMVYHRLPFDEIKRDGKVFRRRPRSPNGIIPTLLSYFADSGSGAWVAWSLQASRSPDGFEEQVPVDENALPNVRASRIALTTDDVDRFYKKFSKEALWPVIFSFLSQAVFREEDWKHFVEINRLFAARTAREAAENAIVWIHDYNLWMVPAFLRPERPDVRIAFFHHTAFPPSDVFNVLPWRGEIIGSLLQCDYVGFHIPRYVENFVEVLRAHGPVNILERETCAPRFLSYGCALGVGEMTTAVEVDERRIGLGAHPVGVHLRRIAETMDRPDVREKIEALHREFVGCDTVLSVERLDYVKGPLEKLQAFEKLLESHPDLHGRVVLINVCTPPADGMTIYRNVRLKVDQAVGRINGRFSRLDWTPVRYFFRSLPFEDVVAYYAASDIAWITPLRDGLNLVAKEYVAAKAHHGSSGVLVLSEFAGVAVEMHGALRTNPYDATSMRETLYRALTLDESERQDRMQRMAQIVQHHDHRKWGEEFLAAVTAVRA